MFLWHGRRGLTLSVALSLAVVLVSCDSGQDGTGSSVASSPTEAPVTTAVRETTTTTTTTTTPETTTTMDPTRSYGGEVVVAVAAEPVSLNPFVQGGGDPIATVIGEAYWAGVQEVDGYTLELIPELVTQLPTVANGGVVINEDGTMTVRYQIRDEATWSDGLPITGEDFQFTLDLILDPNVSVEKTGYEDIVDTDFGPKWFSYTMRSPTVLYELLFDRIIPKHAVDGSDFNNDWNDRMWPSAGPYEFDSWEQGTQIRLIRNDQYWKRDPDTGQSLPFLDGVVFRFVAEEDLLTDFRGRLVDVVEPPGEPQVIEDLRALDEEGVAIEVIRDRVWEHLSFQFGPGRLETNPVSANESLSFRRGIAHTIDYDLIATEILGDETGRLTSILETVAPALGTGAWSQYEHDPATAGEYFAAAREELGLDSLSVVLSTTSNTPNRVTISELLADMFAAVGVEYQTQLEVSQSFFLETLTTGLWDTGLWAWESSSGLTGAISLLDFFDQESPTAGADNYYRWGTADSSVIDDSTARFAEIRLQLDESIDPTVLVPLLQEAEQLLAGQAVIIPLYAHRRVVAVWADEVGGVRQSATPAGYTWNIEQWYRIDL